MKKTFLFLIAAAMFSGLNAQNVQETNAQFGDYTIPAFSVTLKQDKDIVTEAVQQRLKDAGLKVGKTSGHIAAENQTFTEIYAQPIDFYAKVDEQGKKKDRVTVVTFFAKSPNLTISQNELNVNVRRLAENFPTYVERFEASQKADAESKNLKKAQKAQSKAASAVESLDKDIAKDQEKIAKKEAEIAKKEAEIQKIQGKIEDIRKDIEKLKSNIEKNTKKKGEAQDKLERTNQDVQNVESDLNKYRQQAGE